MKHIFFPLLCGFVFTAAYLDCPTFAVQKTDNSTATAQLHRYEGFTEPSKELPLGSYLDGVVQTLHVQTGDRFKQGDVLVSMDSSMQVLAVEVAKLRSLSMAEIRVAEARVAEAEVELESQQELFKTSSSTRRDVRRAEAGLKVAQAELELAFENKQLAEKQYDIEKDRLDLYTMHARFDGEVLSIATEQGAEEGGALRQNDPIMHLAQLDPVVAKISLPEQIVDRLTVGEAYPLRIGERAAPVVGQATRIASVADRGSQLIEVVFEIKNENGAIRSGVRCSLHRTSPIEEAKQE